KSPPVTFIFQCFPIITLSGVLFPRYRELKIFSSNRRFFTKRTNEYTKLRLNWNLLQEKRRERKAKITKTDKLRRKNMSKKTNKNKKINRRLTIRKKTQGNRKKTLPIWQK